MTLNLLDPAGGVSVPGSGIRTWKYLDPAGMCRCRSSTLQVAGRRARNSAHDGRYARTWHYQLDRSGSMPLHGLRVRWNTASPHISPPFHYARRSARCDWAYSLQPARRSVSYAFAVFRSVPPSQRHLDALATNGGEICGLASRWYSMGEAMDLTGITPCGYKFVGPGSESCAGSTGTGKVPPGRRCRSACQGFSDHFPRRRRHGQFQCQFARARRHLAPGLAHDAHDVVTFHRA